MSKRLTTEEFIEKAKKIHGDKYNYELVEYIDNKTPIKIICNRCNHLFEQKPSNHLSGSGCYDCNIKSGSQHRRMTLDSFLQKAYKIHNYDYDYTNVCFSNTMDKIHIKCNNCGEYFYQSVGNHLQGHGCPKCKCEKRNNCRRMTKEDFIEKAKKIHGDDYEYMDVKYKNTKTMVKIFCLKCNSYFYQTPGKHLQGHGCPYCRQSKGERKIKLFLDNNDVVYETQKWFKDCKDINPLPFDFYLPNDDICIEFQGRQHYEIVRHSHNETNEKLKKDLVDRQKKDRIKRDYCKKNNIKLIEIRYDDDIENKLKSMLTFK